MKFTIKHEVSDEVAEQVVAEMTGGQFTVSDFKQNRVKQMLRDYAGAAVKDAFSFSDDGSLS